MAALLPVALLLLLATAVAGARLEPGLAITLSAADSKRAPAPPQWAEAYMVEFVVTMPSDYLMQPQGFSIPVKAWYDGPARKSRAESFGGVDAVLKLGATEYNVHPRIDHLKCWIFGGDDDKDASIEPILPDITRKWKYFGDVVLGGRDAQIWRLEFREGQQVSTYNFYTASDNGAPLKLHMFGANLMEGSHFDEYLYEFTQYQSLATGDLSSVFDVPDLCKSEEAEVTSQRHWLARSMHLAMPHAAGSSAAARAEAGEGVAHWSTGAAHAHWARSYDREPADGEAAHLQRVARFGQALARVAAHNAQPDKTYTMQLGRFADWSEEEYYGVLMPDTWRRKQGLPSAKQARREAALKTMPHAFKPLGKFKRHMRASELPKHVDWRGTGADAGVKDQGYCGSCWAFGATGAMEGAWYLATGQRQSFSEQQLVDCAFDWGVNACDGGDAEPAINMIAHTGGIAIEQDYFYQGIVDYCRFKRTLDLPHQETACRADKFTRAGMFDGFLEVEPRDELALMEAVYRKGPIAVAVDASPDSFGYYKEGVYKERSCSNYDLDHAVLLFGYGTSEDGADYWLVKNSWSKLFGNDGFIKIARGGNDCGISTQASIAVVAKGYEQQDAVVDSRRQAAVRL